MSTDSNTAVGLRERLLDAQSRAESGDYQLALQSVRSVKSAHPRNVYVLAFEKQLEQLHQLFAANQLTEEQKLDILESLPGIVERAQDGQGADLSTGQTAVFKPLTEEAIRQKDERSAALEWLKNQYFQHAHEYVRKGEYDNALAEIRRVFIIEPQNQIAQDFEAQIRQLSQLKRTRQAEPPRPAPPKPVAPAPPPPAPPVAEHRPEIEPHLEPTPEPVEHEESAPRPAAEETQAKPRMSNWVVAAILLTIVMIGIAAFYFIIRPHRVERIKYPGTVSPTGGAVFSPPTTTEERTFVISAGPEGEIARAETPSVEEVADQKPQQEQPAEARQEKREEPAPASRPPESLAKNGGPNVTPPTVTPQQSAPPSTTAPSASPATEESSQEPFVVIEQPPQIVKLETPRFPDAVRKAGVEGQVVVQVQIDAEGRPQQAKVLSSTNSLLEEAVLDAVIRSQFIPGRMSTGPVASSMIIPYRFRR